MTTKTRTKKTKSKSKKKAGKRADQPQNASDMTRLQMDTICELSDLIDKLFIDDNKDQALGPCMITFSRPSGRAKAFGFYHPASWADDNGEKIAEIAINPHTMMEYGFVEVVQTLTHEKVHQWQHEHGRPSRNGYHNGEFAAKMRSLGLMPSSTGKPGGKQTGQKVADYIIEGGVLDQFVKGLPKRLKLPFMGLPKAKKKQSASAGYVKHVCLGCRGIARAKSSMKLRCGECDRPMHVEVV